MVSMDSLEHEQNYGDYDIFPVMEEKTCYDKIFEAIPLALEEQPVTTQELYEWIKSVLPECITDEKCDHGNEGSERSDYEWQHSVRRAQYTLKQKGVVDLVDHIWYSLTNPRKIDLAEEREAELIFDKENIDDIRKDLKHLTSKFSEFVEIKGKRYKRDNITVAKLKILRGFQCQICGLRITKKDGTFYAEGAHIRPKRQGFPETPDNILILCPNHHKEFDLGKRDVIEHNSEYIKFIMNGKEYEITLYL